MSERETAADDQGGAAREPYAAPIVQTFGTIRQLTAKVGSTPDGAAGGSFPVSAGKPAP